MQLLEYTLNLSINELMQETLDAGEARMNNFIAKPMVLDKLYEILVRWIGKVYGGASHEIIRDCQHRRITGNL
jgi:hypothetical protein